VSVISLVVSVISLVVGVISLIVNVINLVSCREEGSGHAPTFQGGMETLTMRVINGQ